MCSERRRRRLVHASAAVCARRARRQRVRLLCERAPQVAGAVVARGGSSECRFGWPAAAALAQQSCRVAEAEHRNDSCATTGSDGSCMRPYKRRASATHHSDPVFQPISGFARESSGSVFASASAGLAESADLISIAFEVAKRVFGRHRQSRSREACCAAPASPKMDS